MSSNPFLPQGNAVAVNASTTSAGMAMPVTGTTLCITNRSRGNAWVSWSNSAIPTAAFPTPGDAAGAQGIEIPAGVQVTIGVMNNAAFVGVILDSGAGVVSFVPGDGL